MKKLRGFSSTNVLPLERSMASTPKKAARAVGEAAMSWLMRSARLAALEVKARKSRSA